MKKRTVLLISIVSVAAFTFLIVRAITRPSGVPVVVPASKKDVLEVSFRNTKIDLKEGINARMWELYPATELELTHQLMILPWGKSLVSPIRVRAFHNGKDIYFYISWKDATEDKILSIDEFSDACALMFPTDDQAKPSTLMMGFLSGANIWQWKASQDREYWLKKGPEMNAYVDFHYPFEEEELFVVSKTIPQSAVNDLSAIRIATITPKETQNVQGRGYWIDGTWHVVFKRSLQSLDPSVDAVFTKGTKRLCAFAVWNGSNRDRGGRKSISGLVELNIE